MLPPPWLLSVSTERWVSLAEFLMYMAGQKRNVVKKHIFPCQIEFSLFQYLWWLGSSWTTLAPGQSLLGQQCMISGYASSASSGDHWHQWRTPQGSMNVQQIINMANSFINIVTYIPGQNQSFHSSWSLRILWQSRHQNLGGKVNYTFQKNILGINFCSLGKGPIIHSTSSSRLSEPPNCLTTRLAQLSVPNVRRHSVKSSPTSSTTLSSATKSVREPGTGRKM